MSVNPAQQTLVLGGGFDGLATANTLGRLLPAEHAITIARRIADIVSGLTLTATFAGKGFCYLETGGGMAWVAQHLAPRRR